MESVLKYKLSVKCPESGDVIWVENINDIKIYDVDNKYIKTKNYEEEEELNNKMKKLKLDNECIVNEIMCDIYSKNEFNDKQLDMIKIMINSILNKNKYISLTGPAGSGKSYTMLNMFKYFKDILKDYNICFVAPTNVIVQRCKENDNIISPYFRDTEYLTVSQLLGERLTYNNNGESIFKRLNKKMLLNKYDIIIIDESSMVGNDKIKCILNELRNGICIFIGDKNQLNPVNEGENMVLHKSNVNLCINMRCNIKVLNKIFNYIIKEIEICENFGYKYNKKMFDIFLDKMIKYIDKKKNNKTLLYLKNKNEFIETYINRYKLLDSIICNYTNNECVKLNKEIKEKIIKENNIKVIDGKYYKGQQLIFMRRYENKVKYMTSEIVKIDDIELDEYKLKNILIEDIYLINCDSNIINAEILYDEIVKNGLTKDLNKILNKFNSVDEIGVNKLYVYNKKNGKSKVNYINVVKKMEENIYEKLIEDTKKQIDRVNKKYKNEFVRDYIIVGLYKLLDKYRINIFANIVDGYSATCHKLQGNTINTIFVNLEDILKMCDSDIKNKLKYIYTALTRASDMVVIYKK